MLTGILFIAGLIFIIKGADLLVDGASSLAKKLKISDLAIGLTIVAFGTSAPELAVNVTASIAKNTDIAIGNIVGSNIANILLILGIAAVIYPLRVEKGTIWKEIPFSLLAALVMGIMTNDILIEQKEVSVLGKIDGMILIGFFIIFLYYVYGIAKKGENDIENETKSGAKQISGLKSAAFIIIGLAGLMLGGKLIVDSATVIAKLFGISTSLVGLTIVAIGTSLPELATSAVAAYKKNASIAVGNVVGSNIFNIFFILGTSAIIHPLAFERKNNFDIGIMIMASMALFSVMFIGKKHTIEKSQGIIFIGGYVAYIAFIVMRG